MPKPNVNNQFVKNAINVWNTPHYTFCLIENISNRRNGTLIDLLVRVFPHDDRESFWLENNSPWETESGAAWSILEFLNNQ